jgi:hypothetical protein
MLLWDWTEAEGVLKPFLCGDTQEKHTAIDFLITALKIKKIN